MKKYGNYKLIIIGDSNVGKTSFTNITVRNTHIPPTPTIGALFIQKTFIMDDKYGDVVPIKIDIWDTAGQERFRSLVPLYYKNTDVVLLFFDTSDQTSFDNIKNFWLHDFRNNSTDQKTIQILVENKIDKESVIPKRDITNFVTDYDLLHYRISVTQNIGINELVDGIIKEIATNFDNRLLKLEDTTQSLVRKMFPCF